jgi:putative ABC transport system substrate-binding protein
MLQRREFITLLGTAVAWPLAARAQQPSTPVIGFLNAAPAQGYKRQVAAFQKGLAEAGYVAGRNVTIEYRWGDGHSDRMPALAAELVRLRPAVIAATGTAAALAAKAATSTIPIVFETGFDPVRSGLVTSLNRPGGNVTGATQTNIDVTSKRLELLHEVLPNAKLIGVLVNPTDPVIAEATVTETQAAARTFGVELHVLNAGSSADFNGAFESLAQRRIGGLVIAGGALFVAHSEQLAAMAARYAVAAAFQGREFAAAGGLMAYGSDFADAYRLTGIYVGRVLKGDKPGDLPVQQATKIELFINLKTAKALGITVALPLLGRADDVIE